jgi:hypothetical protein
MLNLSWDASQSCNIKKIEKKWLIVMKGTQFTKLFILNWIFKIILMEIMFLKKNLN